MLNWFVGRVYIQLVFDYCRVYSYNIGFRPCEYICIHFQHLDEPVFHLGFYVAAFIDRFVYRDLDHLYFRCNLVSVLILVF